MINTSVKKYLFALVLFCFTALAGADETSELIVQDLTAEAAAELIKQNPDFVVLDVRTPLEYGLSHIENAININYYSFSFKAKLDKLDKNKTYILHCQTGVRSGKTIPIMKAAGFTKIYHMDGGFSEWKKAKLPVQ